MRKVIINELVRTRLHRGVVLGVTVILRDRTNAHRYILDDLEGEELQGGE